jgi:hypothetical protein
VNTHHGDTEARRNIGLLYEDLTESILAQTLLHANRVRFSDAAIYFDTTSTATAAPR